MKNGNPREVHSRNFVERSKLTKIDIACRQVVSRSIWNPPDTARYNRQENLRAISRISGDLGMPSNSDTYVTRDF
eukprot:966421-Amorphochlora_amoeboformis.AAC.1